MSYVRCHGCGEIIDIPAELLGNLDEIDADLTDMAEIYYCDACEPPEYPEDLGQIYEDWEGEE